MTPNGLALPIRTIAVACLLMTGFLSVGPAVGAMVKDATGIVASSTELSAQDPLSGGDPSVNGNAQAGLPAWAVVIILGIISAALWEAIKWFIGSLSDFWRWYRSGGLDRWCESLEGNGKPGYLFPECAFH